VSLFGKISLQFAGSGNAETFFDGTFGFHFWHFASLSLIFGCCKRQQACLFARVPELTLPFIYHKSAVVNKEYKAEFANCIYPALEYGPKQIWNF